MIRFVDVREAKVGGRFAFYDTIIDRFESFKGSMVWRTWDEFAAGYEGSQLERHRALCPPWVFVDDDTDVE